MSVITMSHPEAYMSQPSLLCYCYFAQGSCYQIPFQACMLLCRPGCSKTWPEELLPGSLIFTVAALLFCISTWPHYVNSCCSDGEWYWMSIQIFLTQPHDLLWNCMSMFLSAWIVFFLPVEDREFWHFLNRKSLPKVVICKYFLSVCSIPSYPLQIFPRRKTFYNYPKFQAFFHCFLCKHTSTINYFS